MHQFLSPISNKRSDEFGGTLENRMKFPLLIADTVRKIWPLHLPLFVRLSATEWTKEGFDINQSIEFAKELKKIGVDFIDVSTGGNIANASIPAVPHYQVTYAAQIKNEAQILTGAVGLITDPKKAETILLKQDADAIILGRALLRNPYWALDAAILLGEKGHFPRQYERAFV